MHPDINHLSGQHAHSSDFLDLLLGHAREESCLDDNWDLRKVSVPEDLEEASLHAVDDRSLVTLVLLVVLVGLRGHERPQLLDVDAWADVSVLAPAKVSHTNLTEVTRMVLVDVDSV